MSNSKRILAALLAGAMVLCAGCGKEEETEESAVSVHDDGNMPRESFHRFSFLHQFSSHAAIRRS